MENKILIIGQALPAVKQEYPYDTTLWYDLLLELNINKEESMNIFTYDAVYNKFPGYNEKGEHLIPSYKQMNEYYEKELKQRINDYSIIILLGKVAYNFLMDKIQLPNKYIFELPHPSKRNWNLINNNKRDILNKIKKSLNILENLNN